MTVLERRCKVQLTGSVEGSTGEKVLSVSHIHPRAYVVGKCAACCLIVSYPPMDETKILRDMASAFDTDSITTIQGFDKTLKTGDWCTIGYVSTRSCGQRYAIKAVV